MRRDRHRPLSELRNPLERAVFEASYRSGTQKARRALALLTLCVWHTARGLVFLWPIWLGALLLLARDPGGTRTVVLLAILLPGTGIAAAILLRGIREDYRRKVAGRLLDRDVLSIVLR